MQNYTVQTSGVCAKTISFSIGGGKLSGVKFHGGCPGNTAAISKLVEGADAQKIAQILKGNDCGGRGTSCADQLARGIEQALAKSNP
ncbi:MAG: TIGR03905 family TSCPD domain-containing protein [Opitutales bacterium]|nr:TIGR03905 family TSCPD domain-containing protein [Opitutales bacterium]